MKKHYKIKQLAAFVAAMLIGSSTMSPAAFADDNTFSFSLSPMTQSIVLNPGDTYHGSFKVVNPNTNTDNLTYTVQQRSFYVDDNYDTTYDEEDSAIVDWTTFDTPTSGTISPNDAEDVMFTIRVPYDAPSGGQYEAFRVMAEPTDAQANIETGAVIKEQFVITYLLFAEIAGSTYRQGEITGASVPSFLFSGDISGSASIKNTGNIHSVAKYTLQVFPLFSSEELYTNEENPEELTILPDRTLYHETIWRETPAIGIFNIIYTVEFEGVTTQVSKMVIKCPIWLLFIIIFALALAITWLVVSVKRRKK